MSRQYRSREALHACEKHTEGDNEEGEGIYVENQNHEWRASREGNYYLQLRESVFPNRHGLLRRQNHHCANSESAGKFALASESGVSIR
jgi:hypothetical protein